MKRIEMTKRKYWNIPCSRIEYLFLKDKLFTQKIYSITSVVPKDLKPIFGNPSFSYLGKGLVHCWVFEYEGAIFSLASGAVRGTTMECNDPVNLSKIKKFIEEVFNKLRGVKSLDIHVIEPV